MMKYAFKTELVSEHASMPVKGTNADQMPSAFLKITELPVSAKMDTLEIPVTQDLVADQETEKIGARRTSIVMVGSCVK